MKIGRLIILVLLISWLSQLFAENVALPYAQNFDAAYEMPAGWDRILPTGWNGLSVYGYYGQSEPNCLYYWSDTVGESEYLMGIAPAVDWDYYSAPVLTFSAGMYTEGGLRPIEIGYITDISNLSTYVALASFNLTTAYQPFTLDLSSLTGNSRLAFRFCANAPQQGMFLDDILINDTDYHYISLPYTQNFDESTNLPAGWGTFVNVDTYNASITVTPGQGDSTPNSLTFWCENPSGAYNNIFAILPEYDIYAHVGPYVSFYAKTNSIIGSMPILQVGFMSDPGNPATFSLVRSWRLDNHYKEYSIDISQFRTSSRLAIRFCPTANDQYMYVDDVSVQPTAPAPPVSELITLPHYENFDNSGYMNMPTGWNSITTAGDGQGYVSIYSYYATSPPNCMYYWNSSPASLSPRIATVMPAFDGNANYEAHISFTAGCYTESTMPQMSLGYMTDPLDISTFQSIDTITLNQQAQAYSYLFVSPGGNVYIAFVFEPNDVQQGLSLDDVALTLQPYAGPYVNVPYLENFDSYDEYGWPTGWLGVKNSIDWQGDISLRPEDAYSAPNCLSMSNGTDTSETSVFMAIGPNLRMRDITGNTLHFRAKGPSNDPENPASPFPSLAVGYIDDRLNAGSFHSVQQILMTNSYVEYEVTLPIGYDSSLRAFAFKFLPSDPYQTVYIDNVYFGVGWASENVSLPYMQNFDAIDTYTTPLDWRMLMDSTDPEAYIYVNDYNSESDYNSLEMYSASETSATSYWIAAAPGIINTQLGNCMIKFSAMGHDNDYVLRPNLTVGYMSDRSDAQTFVPVETIQTPDWFMDYSISFTAPIRLNTVYPAIRMEVTGSYQKAYIDDFSIETMGSIPRLLPFYEDFEAVSCPPNGWTDVQVDFGSLSDTDPYWFSSLAERRIGCTPYEGLRMAGLNEGTAENSSRLTTPYLNLRGESNVSLSFAVYHSTFFNNSQYDNEGIQVQVSTDGIRWTNIGDFIRRTPTGTPTPFWQIHSFDLSAYAGNPNVRIGLLGRTMNGDHIYVDQLQVVSVQSGLQNLQFTQSAGNVHLTWDAYTGATGYFVYSCSTMTGTFTKDETGTFSGCSWTAPATADRKFYKVTASLDAVRK